jgi:hypothetical protein
MYNSIVLSSCIFGSVFMFSKSVELMNKSISEYGEIPDKLIAINGLTAMFSGFVFVYSFALLDLPSFSSVKA